MIQDDASFERNQIIDKKIIWKFENGEIMLLVNTWITCFQLDIWPQCPQRNEPFKELDDEFMSCKPLLFLMPTSNVDVVGVVRVFWGLKLSVWSCEVVAFELLVACIWFTTPPPRVVKRLFRLWTFVVDDELDVVLVDVAIPCPFNKLFMIWKGIWMGRGGGARSICELVDVASVLLLFAALCCRSCGVPSSR